MIVGLALSGCGNDDSPSYDGFLTGPDTREACADRDPLRQPFFGDLHVHTKYSFDAASNDVRSGPRDAYRFAKGETIGLPPYDANGNPTRSYRLSRPLDFLGVTDHSEFLAETTICTDPTLPGYDAPECVEFRAGYGTGGQTWVGQYVATEWPTHPSICTDFPNGGCAPQVESVWADVVAAAEENYDRSSDCTFTSFVAYEWSGSINGNSWHRNVIFGTRTVPVQPLSYIDYPRAEQLWDGLHANCLDRGVGCDVIAIPHNGNISSGLLFRPTDLDNLEPYDLATARRRRDLEPLAEIYQHKGASECTPGPIDALGSTDEACDFELIVPNVCRGEPSDPPGCKGICDTAPWGGFLGACVAPSDFARGALRVGLSEYARLGADPLAFGFIGSTDTHGATAGGTEEATWPGHVGIGDDEPAERMRQPTGVLVNTVRSSPGGLAVVWAEENSRPSLFSAMRRRETYATSGTRIILRFFGGFDEPAGLCDSPDLVAQAYAHGVPMGGDLVRPRHATTAPRFVVTALRDTESVPLRYVEIVKGWHDGTTTQERVYPLYEAPNGGSPPTVDPNTCTTSGTGADSICTEWVDPDFDPAQPAFYYVRVRENPTCRWQRYVCRDLGVDCSTTTSTDPLYSCCDPNIPKTVEERAWSSPIWYLPPR
ncbi:MAG: DUF3604 domain-containing protein [Polyangiales bacterium]